jgi:hypothetical protein
LLFPFLINDRKFSLSLSETGGIFPSTAIFMYLTSLSSCCIPSFPLYLSGKSRWSLGQTFRTKFTWLFSVNSVNWSSSLLLRSIFSLRALRAFSFYIKSIQK